MKSKQIIKIIIDFLMTIALLLLMTYELIGAVTHEIIGIVMFVLFITHHILNIKWTKNLFKGKYTPVRVLQTILAAVILLSFIGSMISGIIISHHVFRFLPLNGASWARSVHMLCGYWGFILMSLHLGIHWNMITSMATKNVKNKPKNIHYFFTVTALIIAGYGAYAFISRDIASYMLLQNQFVFFDFEEPLILFIIDYMAVMGLFIFAGHYLTKLLKKIKKSK